MFGIVDSVATIDTLATTYNFEVEQTHNYFVGTEGVLVHNAYSAATVETIKATLGANANKWTSFVDRVVRMNVPIAQHAKLYDEISKITNQGDLVKFLDEFEAIEVFRTGIVDDIDLISVWKDIVSQRIPKSNILFLRYAKELKNIALAQGRNLYEHIFIGRTGGTNGISGVHHNRCLTTRTTGFVNGDIRVRPGTKVLKPNGFWEAEIEYFDGTTWIPKTENGVIVRNGFFPDSWTVDVLMEEIALARSNITPNDWVLPTSPRTSSNTFKTTLSNGQEVWFYIGRPSSSMPTNVGNYIITVFPKF